MKTLHKRRLLEIFSYREFQVFGMNVADYITDQKSEHNIEVKEEKEIKKVIKRYGNHFYYANIKIQGNFGSLTH